LCKSVCRLADNEARVRAEDVCINRCNQAVQLWLTDVDCRLNATNERIELDRLEPKVERDANRTELEASKVAGCNLGPVPEVKKDPITGPNARRLEPCRNLHCKAGKLPPRPFLVALDEYDIVRVGVEFK
jgi:hypothetical protein